jgi:uncharacterized surface protein with fasciclin (FAS1) repeats
MTNRRFILAAVPGRRRHWLRHHGPRPCRWPTPSPPTRQLSTLNSLVAKAGLSDMLKGAGPYTVFAPTNDAFKAVPAKTLDELGKNPAQLKAVLAYHVVPAKVMAADVKNGKTKSLPTAPT